jgi:predicted phosphodiesterase
MKREVLEGLLRKTPLNDAELKQILSSSKPRQEIKYHHDFGSKHIKLGLVSDLHIGHKMFDYRAFDKSVRVFDRESVDLIISPGEIIEGMSGREGHIYELKHVGYTAQLNEAQRLLRQYRQPFHFIVGNHDVWGKNKANAGLEIGPEVEKRVRGSKYLGEMDARIDLGKGVHLDLTHRGNTAYALSYSLQKMINGLEGGTKPDIICNGHLHKSIYMFYRNIHALESGTLERQTEFMKMKGSPAMVGFWVLDIRLGRGGVEKFTPTWFPQY